MSSRKDEGSQTKQIETAERRRLMRDEKLDDVEREWGGEVIGRSLPAFYRSNRSVQQRLLKGESCGGM
jgi:hypothetical protein